MPVAGSQLSATKRPKWHYITVGVLLIVVAVTLTVAWQIMGVSDASRAKEMSTLRWVVYFLGTVLFLLLIGGLVVIVTLLVREVRLNERQSNFVSAVTHELKTPVASLKLYLDTLQMRDLPESRRIDFYRTMREDLDRLNSTINNVLNAAMYTDRPVVDPQPLDLARRVRASRRTATQRVDPRSGRPAGHGPRRGTAGEGRGGAAPTARTLRRRGPGQARGGKRYPAGDKGYAGQVNRRTLPRHATEAR